MKKTQKAIAVLLAVILTLALLPTVAFAAVGETFTADSDGVSITYKVLTEPDGTTPGTVQVKGDVMSAVASSTESVNIPATVLGSGGAEYSVTTIGSEAFSNCKSLTSITIPGSVTTVGNGAFWGCKSLTSVNIPDSVTTIGSEAFYNCESLTSITIPGSVTTIGDRTFARSGLTSITIPNSITTIGDTAFYDCKLLTSVTIPDSVATIGPGAFSNCKSLTSVTIPDGVTTIGNTAFEESGLQSITFEGATPPSLGTDLFYNVTGLTTIHCPVGTKAAYESALIGNFPNGAELKDDIDITAPTVAIVTPSGTDAAISGNIVIAFSEAMKTDISGTVKLNGTALSGGEWSNENKTYTIAYSSLSYSTAYTITIDGFADAASNVMVADSTGSFTTMAEPATPDPTPDVYPVETNPGTYSGSGNAVATIDGPYAAFIRLILGGNTVAASNYTTAEGSTVITLYESYVKTLAAGTHTFRAVFTDGYADFTVTIKAAESTPTPAPTPTPAAEPKPKPDLPPPIVGILTDVQKSGDTFSFKIYIANASGNMPGATVTVRLNEKYSTTVTIGEDGVGHGTIEAPGYAWDTIHISTRPNLPGAASVGTAYQIYSDGRIVRR